MRYLLTLLLLTALLAAPAAYAQASRAVITAISPSSYSTSNTPSVTLQGTGFSQSAQAMMIVNGAYWTMSLNNSSSTELNFTPPTYVGAGTYNVVVRTASGDSNAVSLTVNQAPDQNGLPPFNNPSSSTPPLTTPTSPATLSGISPNTLPAGVSNLVTIQGQGFTNGTSVHIIVGGVWWNIDTVAATPHSISFRPPTYLQAGTYPVAVRTPQGASNTVSLTIQALSPSPVPTTVPATPVPIFTPPNPAIPQKSYVALGDSLGQGYFSRKGYVANFRDYLANRFGQPVALNNLSQAGWTSRQLKEALQTNQQYRQAVTKADVVTWNIGGNDLRQARQQYQQGTCGGTNNQACLRTTVDQLKANWSAIVAEMNTLSNGQPKIIRTMDIYNPYVDEDTAQDSWPSDNLPNDFAVMKPYVDETNRYIEQVTTGNGLRYASVYQEFNGQSGTQDPENKGYISFIDDFHPNSDGHGVIARLLAAITP